MRIEMLSCILFLYCVVLSGCVGPQAKTDAPISVMAQQTKTTEPHLGNPLIRSNYEPGEVSTLCEEAVAKLKRELENNVTNAFELDRVLMDFYDATQPLLFMGYVSLNESARKEGNACEEKSNKASVDVFTRRDLYKAVKTTVAKNSVDQRLISEFSRKFEEFGMNLEDRKLSQLRKLRTELNEIETKYKKNSNADVSTVLLSRSDLQGMDDAFLSRQKRSPDGQYVVTTKRPDVVEVLAYAKSSETRRKILMASENRGAPENDKLLNRAISLRAQIAKVMGYKSWADLRIKGNMARTPAKVMELLNGIKSRLAGPYDRDMVGLLNAKRQFLEPNANHVDAWDIFYLTRLIQKRDYDLDEAMVSEYLPADKVLSGMFDVYSTLLNVNFKEVRGTTVWAPEVKLYEVIDAQSQSPLGYFYTDLFPRPGKYGHIRAFNVIDARGTPDGFSKPVAVILGNLNPPSANRPALLSRSNVISLFHEFGHIMHQTLTRVPYGYLSSMHVADDFAEAPSQMLENWVSEPAVLRKISGHYKDQTKPLPEEMIAKIVASQKTELNDVPLTYYYMRMLTLALIDMRLHMTTHPADAEEVYRQVSEEVLKLPAIEGSHFMASFGHLVDGYDAGYYSYLWSKVYAQDLFTMFKKEGILDSKIGKRYRTAILEHGNAEDGTALTSNFLGRTPTANAFYSGLGL